MLALRTSLLLQIRPEIPAPVEGGEGGVLEGDERLHVGELHGGRVLVGLVPADLEALEEVRDALEDLLEAHLPLVGAVV